MRYLHISPGGEWTDQEEQQSASEPTQEELKQVFEDGLVIYRYEMERGFCKAEVECAPGASPEYTITDWVMTNTF